MGKLASNILSTAKPGKHSDGGGLYLYMKSRDERGNPVGSWVYRYTLGGKRREMGMGSVEGMTLSAARGRRDELAAQMRSGDFDPLDAKERQQREIAKRRSSPTVSEIAADTFEAHRGTLKGEGNALRWYGPIRMHLLPKLGSMKVEDLRQIDIVDVLRPIWKTKYPTAKKCLDRLNIILKHAAAADLDVDLQAPEKARLLLGDPGHVEKHHPALTASEAARLFQSLDIENNVQRALALYMLVGAGTRLRPLRLARIEDIHGKTWIFPGEVMKGRKGKVEDFRAPISEAMRPILDRAAQDCVGGYLFSTKRLNRGAPPATSATSATQTPIVSDQAIENVMRDREQEWGWAEPFRPHGIRATFRTWVAETETATFDVAENALAHKVGRSLERSYQRGDRFEQRRVLSEQWANHLNGRIAAEQSRNVISLPNWG